MVPSVTPSRRATKHRIVAWAKYGFRRGSRNSFRSVMSGGTQWGSSAWILHHGRTNRMMSRGSSMGSTTTGLKVRSRAPLLDGHGLREIPRLVDVPVQGHPRVVGDELQRQHRDE